MNIRLHRGDLPADLKFGPVLAVDTETMGLNPVRDRLCLVKPRGGEGSCDLVQIPRGARGGGTLKPLLEDSSVLKLFHFPRFDVPPLRYPLGVECRPVYCTKIASRLVRTFPDRH